MERLPSRIASGLISLALTSQLLLSPSAALASTSDYTFAARPGTEQEALFDNIPGSLGSGADDPERVALGPLISGARGPEVQACARKCTTTCVRGGEGSPGLGPLTLRGELIVFKEGFRSRKYCINECTVVCAKLVEKGAVAAEKEKAEKAAARAAR